MTTNCCSQEILAIDPRQRILVVARVTVLKKSGDSV